MLRTINLRRKATIKRLFKSRSKVAKFSGPDKDYGDIDTELECHQLDLDPQEFENKKIEFLEKLKKTKDQILQIAKATTGQFQCQEWLKERQIRLTASNFGKICKLRPNTSRNNVLVSLLYTKFEGNESTKYGIQHKPFAISEFENIMKIKIHPAGLFIDPEFQFLAASPDGLIDTDSLVEIKCPSSISQMTPTEAIENGTIKWACLKNGELFLKENHNYFYQVQGQLHIAQKLYGYFVIWSPKGLLFQKIKKDDSFFKSKMESFLSVFYHNHMLPEILNPKLIDKKRIIVHKFNRHV